MKTVSDASNYFDQLAHAYAATQRLSPSCAASVVEAILNQVPTDRLLPAVDLGCGDAYLGSLLLGNSELVQCILVDISSAMLDRARHRLLFSRLLDRVLFIRADACAVPLRSGSAAVVLMAFVLHLLPDPVLALNVVDRILAPEGYFFLLTYDPDDLNSHIYQRYFPGYREISSKQFVPIPQLTRLLEDCGFVRIAVSKHSYGIRFRNVDEVLYMVKNKPFSTFANYVDEAFAEGLKEFGFNLRQHFGQGEVFYESKVTLLSAQPSG